MRVMAWVVAFVVAGCVSAPAQVCSDGTVCPAGDTCGPRGGCISPERLAACNGLADGADCEVPTLGTGICEAGACLLAVCGNNIKELDEVCDDGNRANGDGCAGSCLSDERCGNGISELDEECDCGDATHAGGAMCKGTSNGGSECSETCRRRACGNGVVELDEVCDDGNVMPGDGCSFNCRSDETCANNVLDYAAGELCDDGNTRNRDGCSASCQPEALAWTDLSGSVAPSARWMTAMAYDIARGRTVMFGGVDPSGLGVFTTWEHDGQGWRAVVAPGPTARNSHMMAYDAARGRVVLFGGANAGGELDDTWEYDGVAWKQIEVTGPAPDGRASGAMVYDSVRKRVLLVGGNRLGTILGDTWAFDGTAWTLLVSNGPPRVGHALVFDPVRGRVVTFGGGTGQASVTETMELGATEWTVRATASTPPPRMFAGMTWDAKRRRAVLFGGTNSDGIPQGDTWEYDGTNWTQGGAGCSARYGAGMAYDHARARVIVFGGWNSGGRADTWFYNGGWSQPAPGPAPRRHHAIAYDIARGRLVMFGGIPGDRTLRLDDTWEFDGTIWREVVPTTRPPARANHVMAYDIARKRIVMFSGARYDEFEPTELTPVDADTWEFDGTNWERRTLAGPAVRASSVMAYDPVRQRIVLFGGQQLPNFGANFSDTWEYDGTTWTERTLAQNPGARFLAAMTYDGAREKIVLHGGLGADGQTWELDGNGWTPTATGPAATFGHGLAYDAGRRTTLMYGGGARETWELTSTGWIQRDTAVAPPVMFGTALAYDVARGRIVAFAGSDGTNALSADMWSCGFQVEARGEACTAGLDYDGDGDIGCADDECWGICSPTCSPDVTSCPTSPRCGDGVCANAENCRNCPADCVTNTPACPIVCGDTYCDPTETCAGDCP